MRHSIKGVVTHENSIKGTQKSNSKGKKTNAKSNKRQIQVKQSNTPKQNNRTQNNKINQIIINKKLRKQIARLKNVHSMIN